MAGWGVVVSLSGLEWKIALVVSGKHARRITCSEPHIKHLSRPLSEWVYQGALGHLAQSLLFPAQVISLAREWFVFLGLVSPTVTQRGVNACLGLLGWFSALGGFYSITFHNSAVDLLI